MKKIILILAIIAAALLIGTFLKQGGEVKAPQDEIEANAQEELNENQNNSDAATHTLSEAQASYTVEKRWFNKPMESVTGTTQDVEGWLAFDTRTYTLTALSVEINDQTFESGSENRDEDVQAIFASQGNILVTLAEPIQISNIAEMEPASGPDFHEVELMLEINGVEKQVPFKVTTSYEAQGIGAEGTAQINMTDFGIEPPTKLEIFSVGEEVALSFQVTAQRVQ